MSKDSQGFGEGLGIALCIAALLLGFGGCCVLQAKAREIDARADLMLKQANPAAQPVPAPTSTPEKAP